MFVEDILKVRDNLLSPKRSDKFISPLYIEGWRYFEVRIGNKYCYLTPLVGGNTVKKRLSSFKEKFRITYWDAARCHSGRGIKRRSKNWQRKY